MKSRLRMLLPLLFLASGFAAIAGEPSLAPDKPPQPGVRVSQTAMGITQLPDDKMKWILDAKFGMFIHWGLYSGPGQGEWMMEAKGIQPEAYRKYAYPESGDEQFDASDFHPDQWAQLAKDAGSQDIQFEVVSAFPLRTIPFDGFLSSGGCLYRH